MSRDLKTHPIKTCPGCGIALPFDRSYGFHAGFSICGFLYNDVGNQVFVWSSYDPNYVAFVGEHHPWMLTPEQQREIEASLLPSSGGGAWHFANPARCLKCGAPISGPMSETIMGLPFDGRGAPDDPEVDIVRPFNTYGKRVNQSRQPTPGGLARACPAPLAGRGCALRSALVP
jgi:hypothetical protein